jgi:hypothetical protein
MLSAFRLPPSMDMDMKKVMSFILVVDPFDSDDAVCHPLLDI